MKIEFKRDSLKMKLGSGQVLDTISQWKTLSVPHNNPLKVFALIEATGQEILKRVSEVDSHMITFNMKYHNWDKFGYQIIAVILEQLATLQAHLD